MLNKAFTTGDPEFVVSYVKFKQLFG